MALLTKVGSFEASSTTGLQSITGIGFQPKAIIVWSMGGDTPEAYTTTGLVGSIGMATSPSDTRAFSHTNTSAVRTRAETSFIINTNTSDTVIVRRGYLESIDSDGFTLDWTTASASASLFHYLALAGDDLADAIVVPYQLPVSSGMLAVTGAGFEPDAAIFANAGPFSNGWDANAENTSGLGFGVVDAALNQWTTNLNISGSSSPVVGSVAYHGSDGTASLESFDSDGFTLDVSKTSADQSFGAALLLKGPASFAGSMAKTTASAPASQSVSGVGFEPKIAVFSSNREAESGIFNLSIGASDGVGQQAALGHAQTAFSRSGVGYTDRAWIYGSATSSVDAEAVLDSFDSDGFTMIFDPNYATAKGIGYFLLGDSLNAIVDGEAILPAATATATAPAPTAAGGASAAIGSTATASGTGVAVSAAGGATGTLTAASSSASAVAPAATGTATATLTAAVATATAPSATATGGAAAALAAATSTAEARSIYVIQPDAIVMVPAAEATGTAPSLIALADAVVAVASTATATSLAVTLASGGGAQGVLAPATVTANGYIIEAWGSASASIGPGTATATAEPIGVSESTTLPTAESTAFALPLESFASAKAFVPVSAATLTVDTIVVLSGSQASLQEATATTTSPPPFAKGGATASLLPSGATAATDVLIVTTGAAVSLIPVIATLGTEPIVVSVGETQVGLAWRERHPLPLRADRIMGTLPLLGERLAPPPAVQIQRIRSKP